MPKMPDPCATCPFFDRLKEFSKDPQKVEDAWNAMKLGVDFVDLGVDEGIILESVEWTCQEPPYDKKNEKEYLTQYWLDPNWWQTNKPPTAPAWKNRMDNGIEGALRRSHLAHVKSKKGNPMNPGEPVLIHGLWVCVGDDFLVKSGVVEAVGPYPTHVVLTVETPAPKCEFTNTTVCP